MRDQPSILKIARDGEEERNVAPLELGARVRTLRKERNWTLEQAANKAGLARSTLSKIENGQMSPTYDALKKLATGLHGCKGCAALSGGCSGATKVLGPAKSPFTLAQDVDQRRGNRIQPIGQTKRRVMYD